MANRREIEQAILIALRQIRMREENLTRCFAALGRARREARVAFHSALRDLDVRAAQLENMIDALDRISLDTAPAVA